MKSLLFTILQQFIVFVSQPRSAFQVFLSQAPVDNGASGTEETEQDGAWVQSLGWEDPQEKGMAANSGILAWRIPWTEEPDGLKSMGSQRVRHD